MNRESIKSALRATGLFPLAQKVYWAIHGRPVPLSPAQVSAPVLRTQTEPAPIAQAAEAQALDAYAAKMAQEQATFAQQVNVALPEIFQYWSSKYLLPKVLEFASVIPTNTLPIICRPA